MLFVVRFCTSSQVLLSHTLDLRLQMVDVGALFVACLLMLRASFRAGHFDLDVYPSQAVLQGSLTVLLAGVYLLAIGVLAKVVALFHARPEAISFSGSCSWWRRCCSPFCCSRIACACASAGL